LLSCLQIVGELDKAEPLYIQALDLRHQTLGDYHPQLANTMNDLASLYYKQGNWLFALSGCLFCFWQFSDFFFLIFFYFGGL
jgi:hypothetical protein